MKNNDSSIPDPNIGPIPEITPSPPVDTPLKNHKKGKRFGKLKLPHLLLSLIVVAAGYGIVRVVLWQSNTLITQKTETTSDASVNNNAGTPVLNMIDLGINNATTLFQPISYYDDVNQKTYVVWSGGVKLFSGYGLPTYETSAMHVFIKFFDHKKNVWSATQKVFEPNNPLLYGDGHYRQGVLVDNAGYVHVFQSYHISLRPANSNQVVEIRHAVSKLPNSIAEWNVSTIPGTERNTHAFYFKSNSGAFYGIYRKSYPEDLTGATEGFREQQWMFKSIDNGKTFNVWDVIIPPMTKTDETWADGSPAKNVRWITARLAGHSFDPNRNGVHMVFDFTGGRATFINRYYYVFFNFGNDSFYCANGINLGNKIDKSDYDILLKNCVILDLGKPIEGRFVDANVEIMSDFDGSPKVYFVMADKNTPSEDKYIREFSYDTSSSSWKSSTLSHLGKTYHLQDVVAVSKNEKYLFALTLGNNLPAGMGESWVMKWNGTTWNRDQKITSNTFYPTKQSRNFTLVNNRKNDLFGFFINLHDSVFSLPTDMVSGYYDGPIKTKLLAFKIASPPTDPTCTKQNWPTKIAQNASGTFSVVGTDADSVPGSSNPLVEFYFTKKIDNYCVPKDAQGKTTGNAVDGRWQKLGGTTSGTLAASQTLNNTLLNLPVGKYMMTTNLKDNDNQFSTGNPGPNGCGYTYNGCSGEFEIVASSNTTELGPTEKQITISAKGIFGGTTSQAWPQLELRIKNSQGVYQPVYKFTINSATYKNFTYTHTTALNAGQVRLAFVNDNGPRDVWVDYIKIGNTVYQTEASTTYSTGTWNSNTGNCDAYYPQSEALHCNGEFHYLKNQELLQSTRVNIVAKGVYSNGAWPLLEVWIKNSKGVYEKKKSISIDSSGYKTFSYDHPALFDASQVRLKFVNGDGPRNVQVQSIKFGTATYPTNAYGTYSTGSWSNVTKVCTAGYPYNNSAYSTKDTLACNGYFDYFKR